MPRRPRTSPEERERIVAEWTASGLNAAAFAESRGIALCTLYGWRREARKRASVPEAAVVEPPPTFAELVVRTSEPIGAGEGASRDPIEIAVDDVVVRVDAAFDDDHLRRILDLLDARRRAS